MQFRLKGCSKFAAYQCAAESLDRFSLEHADVVEIANDTESDAIRREETNLFSGDWNDEHDAIGNVGTQKSVLWHRLHYLVPRSDGRIGDNDFSRHNRHRKIGWISYTNANGEMPTLEVDKGFRQFTFPLGEFYPLLHSGALKIDLPLNRQKSADADYDADCTYDRQGEIGPKDSFVITVLLGGRNDPYIGINVFLMFGLECWAICLLWYSRRNWKGWLLVAASLCCLVRLGVSLHREGTQREREYRQSFQHNSAIVPHKSLDSIYLLGYIKYRGLDMANVLNTDKRIAMISNLAEGSSIRSIERMTGVHRDTIMRLGVKVGQGCTALMDEKMRNLPCIRLEMDEIWGFVGKKERNVRVGEDGVGSVWTFCAIDADTKLVPAFKVGDRDNATANAFVADVASRMKTRVQISTDGLRAYVQAIENAFGGDVDYAQVIKIYGHEEASNNRRYSAPEFVSSEKVHITGRPDMDLVSTSYVERLNATTRLHMRRLTRLTLAFSKKRENFEAAVGLHFAYYNFVKRHNTIRCTPAMAAGVASSFWSVGDLVEAA